MESDDAVIAYYNVERARSQRQSDDMMVDSGSRQHWAEILEETTNYFGRPISVLDVGCGTGRFFYCLRNVDHLLGVDVSPDMLEQARTPIRSDKVDIENIEFMCGDIFEVDLSDRKFDFIFSIGVLGEDAPVNAQLCEKLLALLKPNGKLFFTVVDTLSRFDHRGYDRGTLKMWILARIFDYSPNWLRACINRCCSSFYMTRTEIQKCLAEGGANTFKISRYLHIPGTGWQGAHYECSVVKRDAQRNLDDNEA